MTNREVIGTPSATFYQPSHFPEPAYNFAGNEVTPARTELGRRLFLAPLLSAASTISCENCHQQWGGFADPLHPISHGIDHKFGKRNSPGLANMAWYPHFMWDGGVIHIENQPLAPIVNEVEMGSTLKDVLDKLNRSPYYQQAFEEAYGVMEINSQSVLRAFAQYLSALVSDGSTYDDYLKGNTSALSSFEREGLELFQNHCQTCHNGALLTDFSFRDNGLTLDYSKDEGRAHITLQPQDSGKFKVPTLRNIEKTFPYMHDGSMGTLEDVLEHYSTGILPSKNLDPNLPPGGFGFTDNEKEALIAFLKTLTDENFCSNPLLDNPW
jgi:cytochrome c peroxidase